MMTKAAWNVDNQTAEWEGAAVNKPTLDEAVEQYYRWNKRNSSLYDFLRADTMQYIRENYREEAVEKYPELML